MKMIVDLIFSPVNKSLHPVNSQLEEYTYDFCMDTCIFLSLGMEH